MPWICLMTNLFWVNLFLICAWVFSTLKYPQKSYVAAECLLVRWALLVPCMTQVFRSRGNDGWSWFLPLLVNCLTSLRWHKMSCQKVIWDLFWERDFYLLVNYNFHSKFQHLFQSGGVSHASYTAAEAYLGQGLNLADATQPALQTRSFFVPFLSSSPSVEKSGKDVSRFSCGTCGSFSPCFCSYVVPWFIYKW